MTPTRPAATAVTGTRTSRTRPVTPTRTMRHHIQPLTAPAAAATTTVAGAGTRPMTTLSAVSTANATTDQPTAASGGTPRHHVESTGPRCSNGTRTSRGSSSPMRNQDSDVTEPATATAAHGD